MSAKISLDECWVNDGGARVRTRCLKADIDDMSVARVTMLLRLAAGDQILLQCVNHARDTVLWQRRYIVASRQDFLKRTENDVTGNVNVAESFECRVVAEADWVEVTPMAKPVAAPVAEPAPAPADPKAKGKAKETEARAA